MTAPTISLNNGKQFPQLGLGTWLARTGEVEEAIKYAIDLGYRHFDCAMVYGNEHEIGTAIREKIEDGTVTREELFITTKLWNTFHEIEKVVPTCKQSLQNLGLEYLDLYLLHWPVAQKLIGELDKNNPFNNTVYTEYDYVDTWKGLEECVRMGLTKSIGVSNFNSKQLTRLLEHAKIVPVTNQIEVNPLLTQKKLINFCKEKNIVITAYSPFGSPARPWKKTGEPEMSFDNPILVNIAKKYGKTSAQVILRYLLDVGTIPVPKSSNKNRLKENFNIFDFKLSAEDIAVIDVMNCNFRSVPADEFKGAPYFPFDEEF